MSSARGKDIAALLVVLMAAALMRLSRLDAVEFFHDEAMVSMMAQEMADGLTFPVQGILSSVGIPNPPTSIYTLALPFALSGDPIVVTGVIAALNVLAAGVLWLIARRYFGVTVALIAGLAFAFSPWATLYSRKIWAQDYLNPFLLLALYAALRGFVDGRRWGQVIALPLMLYAMQIHFAGWALVPLFMWIFVTGRRRIHARSLAVSLALSALVMLPYLIGLTQTLQSDPTRIADTLDRSGGARTGEFTALLHAGKLALGVDVESWVTPHLAPEMFDPPRTLGILAAGVLFILAAAGLIRVARTDRRWLIAFALWIALPVVAFQVALADVWPHYFVPQLPAFALLIGFGAAEIAAVVRTRAIRTALLVGLCAVFAGQAVYFHTLMNHAYTHDVALGAGTSGYTTPMTILRAVQDALPDGVEDVVVLSDGDHVWFDAEAARWPVLLRDAVRCVRTLPPTGMAVAPKGPFSVITAPTAPDALRERYRHPLPVTIPARIGEGSYAVSSFDTAPIAGSLPHAHTAAFANGVTLTGFDAGASLTLAFTLPDAPDRRFYAALDADYQYFVHLLDASGSRIAQADARFWSGRHWCDGDRLLLQPDLTVTPDTALIRFGFYKIIDAETGTVQAVDVLDAMGNPAGNWTDIPLPAD